MPTARSRRALRAMLPTNGAQYEAWPEDGGSAHRATKLLDRRAGRASVWAAARRAQRRSIGSAPAPESHTSRARPGEGGQDAAEPAHQATTAEDENEEQDGESSSGSDQRRGDPPPAIASFVHPPTPCGSGDLFRCDPSERRMALSPDPVADPSRAKPTGKLCAIDEGAPRPHDALRSRRWRRVGDDAGLDVGQDEHYRGGKDEDP